MLATSLCMSANRSNGRAEYRKPSGVLLRVRDYVMSEVSYGHRANESGPMGWRAPVRTATFVMHVASMSRVHSGTHSSRKKPARAHAG